MLQRTQINIMNYSMAKKPRGTPIQRLDKHNLCCIYCNGVQDLETILQASKRYNVGYRFYYSCDCCQMSLQVYKSRNGMLSVQNNSSRLSGNIKLGINRITIQKLPANPKCGHCSMIGLQVIGKRKYSWCKELSVKKKARELACNEFKIN